MSIVTQSATAEIIPFSRLAARIKKRDTEGFDRLQTAIGAERPASRIEWGSHYHEAAIAEDRSAPHS